MMAVGWAHLGTSLLLFSALSLKLWQETCAAAISCIWSITGQCLSKHSQKHRHKHTDSPSAMCPPAPFCWALIYPSIHLLESPILGIQTHLPMLYNNNVCLWPASELPRKREVKWEEVYPFDCFTFHKACAKTRRLCARIHTLPIIIMLTEFTIQPITWWLEVVWKRLCSLFWSKWWVLQLWPPNCPQFCDRRNHRGFFWMINCVWLLRWRSEIWKWV